MKILRTAVEIVVASLAMAGILLLTLYVLSTLLPTTEVYKKAIIKMNLVK